MSGTRAISTTSRCKLSSSFFLQGKAPKEIHAILTETLAFSFLVGLRTYLHPGMWCLLMSERFCWPVRRKMKVDGTMNIPR
jgi:hypothetical protein